MNTTELAKRVFAKCHTDLEQAMHAWLTGSINDQELVKRCGAIGQWLVDHIK